MKILLVGEYSRLHNSLKEGLIELGHEVSIIGTGDQFKKYQVDFSTYPHFFYDYWIPEKFKNILFHFTGFDIANWERAIRFYHLIPNFYDYDHVQLINSDAIESSAWLNRLIIKKIFTNIQNRSLLICGDETPIIEYLIKQELKYSILTPFFENQKLRKEFKYSLKYLNREYQKTFQILNENCQDLITSDLDYKIPMDRMKFETTLIPNPININEIVLEINENTDKIILFLGINRLSYLKKGIAYFEDALKIIQEKYSAKIEIITTENIPYHKYISLYNKAHILLDQVYSYDQGYNALEAMAKGKVVFTGAESEFTEHYNISERVCVNAIADVNYLVNELSFLIENPQEIIAMGKRARAFIEKEHDYVKIAKKYLEVWEN
jgi:glycosyltransferase involved in cell wall biosynthesis